MLAEGGLGNAHRPDILVLSASTKQKDRYKSELCKTQDHDPAPSPVCGLSADPHSSTKSNSCRVKHEGSPVTKEGPGGGPMVVLQRKVWLAAAGCVLGWTPKGLERAG